MELPLKVELSRLSHIHVLQLFLPFVPGTVVTMCLMLSSSPIAQRFMSLGIGYRTKLAIVVAITYLIGLAMMTVMGSANNVVMNLVKQQSSAIPWNNTYWRRVAVSYVGDGLSPASASFSHEDLDRLMEYSAARARHPGLGVPLSEKLRPLEEALRIARENIAKAGQVSTERMTEQSTRIQDVTRQRDNIYNNLSALGIETEWHSLFNALEFLPTAVQGPFETVSLLWSSLQVAGVGGICMMIQYQELRNVPAVLFCTSLVISTSYALWLDHRLGEAFRDLASSQIAAMIRETRQGPNQRNSSGRD